MVHSSGSLSIKILPRHANLEVTGNTAGPPPEQVCASAPFPGVDHSRFAEQTNKENSYQSVARETK
eukprot:2742468-Pyramimonas_sp.AAC.1